MQSFNVSGLCGSHLLHVILSEEGLDMEKGEEDEEIMVM